MGLANYAKKAFSMPPGMLARKVVARFIPSAAQLRDRLNDATAPSYCDKLPFDASDDLIRAPDAPFTKEQLAPHANWLSGVSKLYVAHTFDLLGSGWIRVEHGMDCPGLEGHRYAAGGAISADASGNWLRGRINKSNLGESRRVWQRIDDAYRPIAWQLDFKSGHAWSERTWYRHILYGHKQGVDVKVPWELARAQHLPQLALAFASATKGVPGFDAPEIFLREFRNQTLDFIATNPPRFGVNWTCTMDVAIRVSNWLAAYGLFTSNGAEFDAAFNEMFQRSVYEHSVHIINNLEFNPDLRGNHYLSDLVGLLFCASALPRSPETDFQLAFATREFIKEIKLQFHGEGSNFEGSTCYHRLSTELAVYGAAIILGLDDDKKAALADYDHCLYKVPPGLEPPPVPLHAVGQNGASSPLPPWFFDGLADMASFTINTTGPGGRVIQFGDNDSGRFLKLQPIFKNLTVAEAVARYANLATYNALPDDAVYLNEDHLDHAGVVSAVNGLLDRSGFADFAGQSTLDAAFTASLSRNVGVACNSEGSTPRKSSPASASVTLDEIIERTTNVSDKQINHIDVELPGGSLLDGLGFFPYPEFGIYIYRSRRVFLAIRCGAIGQRGFGGHSHNDQLAVVLYVDGVEIITDPGTYVYTPLADMRNKYRSVETHFAPRPVPCAEPGNMQLGPFRLGDEAKAKCLRRDSRTFIGTHAGYASPVFRMVRLYEDKIEITDWFEDGGVEIEKETIESFREKIARLGISPAYGIRYNPSKGE